MVVLFVHVHSHDTGELLAQLREDHNSGCCTKLFSSKVCADMCVISKTEQLNHSSLTTIWCGVRKLKYLLVLGAACLHLQPDLGRVHGERQNLSMRGIGAGDKVGEVSDGQVLGSSRPFRLMLIMHNYI